MSAKPLPADLLDTLIVGGGAAGLSAATVLGRCLRRVLICDAGHPRNEAAQHMNCFLSRDGMPPAEFLRIGREQLRRYETVEFRHIEVEDVERHEDYFTGILKGGERVHARMFLLATGVVDLLPEIEGLRQFWGKTAHNCPFCDGWEHRGQPLAVLGCDQDAVDLTIELMQWSKDLVLCTNGSLKCATKDLRTLRRLNIPIIETPVSRLTGTGEKLEQIHFSDGTALARQGLFFSPGQVQRSPFAEKLGCKFCEEEGCIECGENACTSVPGVYAAGNASRGVQLVIAAAHEGMQAAFAINEALIEADAETGELAEEKV